MKAYLENCVLEVKNLRVSVENKEIVKGISLSLHKGEVVYLFGRNGEGKSTLLRAIAGYPGYRIIEGKVFFEGEDITNIPMHERAKKGLILGFQHPPEFDTIRVEDLFREIGIDLSNSRIVRYIRTLKLRNLLKRPLNNGFSGGEKKRMETFLVLAMNPKIALFDEPDSGVDIDSLKLVASALKLYREENPEASYLIVTHQGYLLDLLPGNRAMVILEGKLLCTKNPYEVYQTIMKYGYERCLECLKKEIQ